MRRLILLFQSDDCQGIVAKVSAFVFHHGANIISADQYSTDPEGGYFFLRMEFYIDEAQCSKEDLEIAFAPIAAEFNAQAVFHYKDTRLRMGICVSKPDHCLFDLLYLVSSGDLDVDVPLVVSNCENHRKLVDRFDIPFYYVPAGVDDRCEEEVLNLVKEKTDFLALARYMMVFSEDFLVGYGKDIINIHHSFLPSFKGANPYQRAYDRGVKVIGATAHFVTASLDEGPIISQMVEAVTHRDSVDLLIRKGKNLEKRALSQALHEYTDYRVMKYKNRTIVFS